jgi:hypothetical protein
MNKIQALVVVLITVALAVGFSGMQSAHLIEYKDYNPAQILGFYFVKTIFPTQLRVEYGLDVHWIYAIPAAVLILAALRSKWIAMAILLLVPYLGIKYIPYLNISFAADRYMYLSMVPLAILGAMMMRQTWISAAVVATFGVMSFFGTLKWENTETLYSHSHGIKPTYGAAMNLGLYYEAKGDLDNALKFYKSSRKAFLDEVGRTPYDANNRIFNIGNGRNLRRMPNF